jgi:hypothetical protein
MLLGYRRAGAFDRGSDGYIRYAADLFRTIGE